jgi:hypothetical protein
MSNTDSLVITELSDAELDTVAAAGWGFKQISYGNVAVQIASNNQLNIAGVNYHSSQGGSQTNNNNAGNQA